VLVGLDPAVAKQPLDLRCREVRVEHQSCQRAHPVELPGCLEVLAALGSAPVLPDDGPMERSAVACVPGHDRLALHGDADRGDGLTADGIHDLGKRGLGDLPDLLGVVLHPTRLREVLCELAMRHVAGHTAVVDGERTHARGTCIDRDHPSHGGTPYATAAQADPWAIQQVSEVVQRLHC